MKGGMRCERVASMSADEEDDDEDDEFLDEYLADKTDK